jgi:hypothetical protein
MYLFRSKMSSVSIIFALLLLAVSCIFFTVNPALGKDFSNLEEDIFVQQKVINEQANEAGMFLLSWPDSNEYDDSDGSKEYIKNVLDTINKNGLVLADKYPDKDNSWTRLFSGGANQIPGDSGFTLSISVKDNDSELTPTLGIGRFFYLTKENLGNKAFGDMLDLVESMEPNEENRVIPDPSRLSSIGFGVRCRYPDGTERDITDLIAIEIELNEKAEGKLKLVYGCMIVDREITNDQEGKPLEGENTGNTYLSDGETNSKIEATWWITNTNIEKSGNGGGCNSGFTPLAFVGLSASLFIRPRRRSK